MSTSENTQGTAPGGPGGGGGLASPCQIHTFVSIRVPFIPNTASHLEIPLGNAISSAISPVSVVYYNIVAGRQELSVACPKSSSQTVLTDLASTFRSTVVDINHLVQRRSACPNSPQLPCFRIPGRRNSGLVRPPVRGNYLFSASPLFLSFSIMAFASLLSLSCDHPYRPSDVHDVQRPFLADCLQNGMSLISLRRFNLPIKRDHFISDLLWSFPLLAVFLMCLCLSRPPLYQNITDHLNPFWWDHYRERFVASLLFPNLTPSSPLIFFPFKWVQLPYHPSQTSVTSARDPLGCRSPAETDAKGAKWALFFYKPT